MIVTSKDEAMRWAMFDFLKARNVLLSRSEDFQACLLYTSDAADE